MPEILKGFVLLVRNAYLCTNKISRLMAKTIQSGDILLGQDNQDTNLIYRREEDGTLTFVKYSKQALHDNLMYVDTGMPELIAYFLPWIDEHQGASFEETASYLEQSNPYNYPPELSHRLYPHRLATLAAYAAMGIPVNTGWNGRYKENYLQILFKGTKKTYASIQLGDLHILSPSCHFYSQREEKGRDIRLKLIIRYEE